MKNVDEHIPQPDRPKDKDFLMPVEDVFSISGRGTVATGRVESGVLKTGDEIEIVGIKETKKSVCTGVEMFRKLLDSGEAGDNVGVLLRGKPGPISLAKSRPFEPASSALTLPSGKVIFIASII